MRYEFYDHEGNLLGLRENPDGIATKRDEKITLRIKDQTAIHWRAIGVSVVVGGLQKVTITPL